MAEAWVKAPLGCSRSDQTTCCTHRGRQQGSRAHPFWQLCATERVLVSQFRLGWVQTSFYLGIIDCLHPMVSPGDLVFRLIRVGRSKGRSARKEHGAVRVCPAVPPLTNNQELFMLLFESLSHHMKIASHAPEAMAGDVATFARKHSWL